MPFAPNISDRRDQVTASAFEDIARYNYRGPAEAGAYIGRGIETGGGAVAGGIQAALSGVQADAKMGDQIAGETAAYQEMLPQMYGQEQGGQLLGSLNDMMEQAGGNRNKQAGALMGFRANLQDFDSAYRQRQATAGYLDYARQKAAIASPQASRPPRVSVENIRGYVQEAKQKGYSDDQIRPLLGTTFGAWAEQAVYPKNSSDPFRAIAR